MVHAGGGRRLGGSAAHHPGRATLLLRSGDHDGADPAGGIPLGAAPERGADRLHPTTARPRSPGTCSGLRLSAAGLAIIADFGSRSVRLSGHVRLRLGDPGLTIIETDLHSSAPAHGM